ncbi:MAG: hypothetical protein CMG05_03585 [Candidatus Marinimicrobia bacterium]|nr:hypothetical protein [Candidatus Neomarinimicrobiota bacterium]|tara:strand:- start:937 stop:1743 length:807 start_codon:yes stop_codon:yes gene_type:complete
MHRYFLLLFFNVLLFFGGCEEFKGTDCDGNSTIQLFDECYSIENTSELNLFFRNPTSIPIEIKGLINLSKLSVNGRITGGIPVWIGDMTSLTHLEIGDPEGVIPSEIGNLTNLTHLVLTGSGLSGEIPPEIGNLVSLTYLALTESGLSGEIPPEIGNLVNLSQLILSYNQLSGGIPAEIGNLNNLIHLSLRSNQLAGTIPEVLCSFLSPTFTEYSNYYVSGSYKDFQFDLNSLCPPYPFCIDTTWIEQQFGFNVLNHYVGQQDTTNCD